MRETGSVGLGQRPAMVKTEEAVLEMGERGTVIISHRSAAEFWRLFRQRRLPRVGVSRWLSDPLLGIRILGSGIACAEEYERYLDAHQTRDISTVPAEQFAKRLLAIPDERGPMSAQGCEQALRDSTAPDQNALSGITAPLGSLWPMSSPLHVLVDDPSKRSVRNGISCHVTSARLPEGAFCRLSRHVCVCMPELVFVQMANELHRAKLVRLGFELCGGYCLMPHTQRGFADCYSVTTPGQLLDMIQRLEGINGRKQADIAAKRVADRCASPAEADFAVQLCFPRREGGRGIEQPELNAWVPCNDGDDDVSEAGLGHGYYCDQYYRRVNLVVECDGREGHSDDAARIKDASKHRDLLAHGTKVLAVVNSQIRDVYAMNTIARQVGKILKYRYRPFTAADVAAQKQLHDVLFG